MSIPQSFENSIITSNIRNIKNNGDQICEQLGQLDNCLNQFSSYIENLSLNTQTTEMLQKIIVSISDNVNEIKKNNFLKTSQNSNGKPSILSSTRIITTIPSSSSSSSRLSSLPFAFVSALDPPKIENLLKDILNNLPESNVDEKTKEVILRVKKDLRGIWFCLPDNFWKFNIWRNRWYNSTFYSTSKEFLCETLNLLYNEKIPINHYITNQDYYIKIFEALSKKVSNDQKKIYDILYSIFLKGPYLRYDLKELKDLLDYTLLYNLQQKRDEDLIQLDSNSDKLLTKVDQSRTNDLSKKTIQTQFDISKNLIEYIGQIKKLIKESNEKIIEYTNFLKGINEKQKCISNSSPNASFTIIKLSTQTSINEKIDKLLKSINYLQKILTTTDKIPRHLIGLKLSQLPQQTSITTPLLLAEKISHRNASLSKKSSSNSSITSTSESSSRSKQTPKKSKKNVSKKTDKQKAMEEEEMNKVIIAEDKKLRKEEEIKELLKNVNHLISQASKQADNETSSLTFNNDIIEMTLSNLKEAIKEIDIDEKYILRKTVLHYIKILFLPNKLKKEAIEKAFEDLNLQNDLENFKNSENFNYLSSEFLRKKIRKEDSNFYDKFNKIIDNLKKNATTDVKIEANKKMKELAEQLLQEKEPISTLAQNTSSKTSKRKRGSDNITSFSSSSSNGIEKEREPKHRNKMNEDDFSNFLNYFELDNEKKV